LSVEITIPPGTEERLLRRRAAGAAASVLLPTLTIAALVGLWWLATIVFDWKPFLVPSPTTS
jgi:ABC-type nitrate/sulfonate/bicarbonate transport system permease component